MVMNDDDDDDTPIRYDTIYRYRKRYIDISIYRVITVK